MKKMYRKKEEGVSPVIATILMVAITVVLAATVWLLVSGYLGGSSQQLQGTLQYDRTSSNLDAGWANFTVMISQPTDGLNPDDVNVLVGSTQINYASTINGDNQWTFIDANADGKLSSGETIIIHSTALDHGVKVTIGATGYQGSISITIP